MAVICSQDKCCGANLSQYVNKIVFRLNKNIGLTGMEKKSLTSKINQREKISTSDTIIRLMKGTFSLA